MRPLLSAAAAALLLSGTFAQDLLPRDVFFHAAQRSQVQLSGEGTHVGWLADHEGRRQLFVGPVDDPAQAICITADGGGDVLQWLFAKTEEHILFTRAVGDAGDVHLHVIPKQGGSIFDVTPDAEGATRIAGHNRTWRSHVALEYEPTGEERGLWLLEFLLKERHRMCDGGFDVYVFDGNMWPAGAHGTRGGKHTIVQMLESRVWKVVRTYDDPAAASVAGVVSGDFNGDVLFFTDGSATDKSALIELDLDSGDERVLFEDSLADVLPVDHHVDWRTNEPHAVASYYGRLRRHVLDEAIATDYELLALTIPSELVLAGRNADDRKWLLREQDGGPHTYWLYDRDTLVARRLFRDRPALDGVALATRRRMIVPTRDGLALPCDLYLPPGADADGDGAPDEPLPTVVWAPSDPSTRQDWNDWSINRHVQLLVSRGYAVIRAEVRGSAGYGKSWLERGRRARERVTADLEDVARWAVSEGVADRRRVAVCGTSMGGATAIAALARAQDSETFTCGIAAFPADGVPAAESMFAALRDPDIEEESEETILVFPYRDSLLDSEPETWVAFWSKGEAFLAKHLGGKSEEGE